MDEKRNIKLLLAYDGKRYHGWQRHKNDISIQDVIEKKIQLMTRESVSLIASGRTDAGVHAINQVCNFFTESSITPESFKNGLNSLLPDDIYIRQAEYSPFRNYFAITIGDNTIEIYDKNWNKIFTHQGNPDSRGGKFSFSPDEKYLLFNQRRACLFESAHR